MIYSESSHGLILCRWKDMWAKHFQSAVFVVALCTFLTTEDLATLPQVQEAIGSRKHSFSSDFSSRLLVSWTSFRRMERPGGFAG